MQYKTRCKPVGKTQKALDFITKKRTHLEHGTASRMADLASPSEDLI
jgi:hypothetical protein